MNTQLASTYIRGVFVYVILTVILYFFGPISWPYDNSILFVIFLTFSWSFFIFGYLSYPIRRANRRKPIYLDHSKLLRWATICNLITVPVAIYFYTGKSLFDMSLNLTEQGAAFNEFQVFTQEIERGGMGKLFIAVRASLMWLVYMQLAMIGVFWRRYSKVQKLVVIGNCVLFLMLSIARGTDKQVVDLFLFVFTGVFIAYYGVGEAKIRKSLTKKTLSLYISVFILSLVILGLFAERRIQRWGGDLPSCFTIYSVCTKENIVWDNIPILPRAGLTFGTNYLTQGYSGLSKALVLEWDTTLVFGQSSALMSLAETASGVDVYSSSFNYKLRDEWDDRYFWSSMFTWLGNNFSFWMVPILMFLYGRYAKYLISRVICSGCHLASASLSFMVIFVVYSPANYQLGVNFDLWIAWVLSLFYVGANYFPRFLRFKRRMS